MRSLAYISSAVVPFSSSELLGLLTLSRERNRESGLTGMLLYRKSSFIQVLEGEQEAVRRTYARISRDPRHKGCISLLDFELRDRQFADWEMGFRNLNDPEVHNTPGYSAFLNADFSDEALRGDPSRTIRLLHSFRRANA